MPLSQNPNLIDTDLPLFRGDVICAPMEDTLRLKSQNLSIYQCLKWHRNLTTWEYEEVSNVELWELSGSKNLSGRISDIRAEIKPYGWTIKLTRREGNGVNYYRLERV